MPRNRLVVRSNPYTVRSIIAQLMSRAVICSESMLRFVARSATPSLDRSIQSCST
ncbi:Uncharacterised protein [Mycobacteroides abscessus subsp. abscessus]|nr:Uncharacterised protein [Mycobacteroides abscessus subsp. abscessus]